MNAWCRALTTIVLAFTAPARSMELWLDCRRAAPAPTPSAPTARPPSVELLRTSSAFDRLVVNAGEHVDERELGGASVLEVASSADGAGGAGGACRLVDAASRALLGASVPCHSPDDQGHALALVGSVAWLHVDAGRTGFPFISSENLLGAAEGTGTQVAVTVSSAADVPGLAFALERGVDALVCPRDASAALLEALQIAKAQRLERAEAAAGGEQRAGAGDGAGAGALALEPARVTAVVDGGVADRVAVDFTRLLAAEEGCLVGSSAKALAFVHGETVQSGFVPPRPFRCNAGPVHAYVRMADGSCKYLSELCAGDRVLIASVAGGAPAEATVGRCKVEPRPTLRVEFAAAAAAADAQGVAAAGAGAGAAAGGGGRRGQLFLQQAETVRLGTTQAGAGDESQQPSTAPRAEAITAGLPVTAARPGDTILVRWADKGTHVGKDIAARVSER